jgi:hypothetical protein
MFFTFIESPSNSLPTIKFPKNHITSSYCSNMPKTAKAKIWPLRINNNTMRGGCLLIYSVDKVLREGFPGRILKRFGRRRRRLLYP